MLILVDSIVVLGRAQPCLSNAVQASNAFIAWSNEQWPIYSMRPELIVSHLLALPLWTSLICNTVASYDGQKVYTVPQVLAVDETCLGSIAFGCIL